MDTVARIVLDGRSTAASAWIEGLRKRVELLAESPLQGRIVPEWLDTSLREVIHGRYRVIYRAESDRVYIVTISHSRRLLPTSEPGDAP